MIKYFRQIWFSKNLRKKILFTIFIVIVARLAAHITIPGANLESLESMLDRNEILGLYSMLTGGSLKNFSIILMGLSPYINASIIMQLLTIIIPKLETLSKEGDHGRQKINKITRWITLPLAFIQSYGMILLLNSQTPVIENINSLSVLLPIMITISCGTVFLMWLGELITEKGLGNGISILIFIGIIAGIPDILASTLGGAIKFNSDKLIPFIIILLITVILTVVIILVTEAYRSIPITYAGRGLRAKSENSMLPIRINQAGMIPIIFAVSLVSFPSIIAKFFLKAETPWIKDIASYFSSNFNASSNAYLILYFLLVIGFTYFYISITFNPKQVAENIQKRGGFIPGIRPGKQTAEYLAKVSGRLTLFGGSFLAAVAILPIVLQKMFASTSYGSVPLLISGAGMIIIVGVVLELVRQVNAQLIMHDYDKLY